MECAWELHTPLYTLLALYIHVFPGSLTLVEMRAALWSARWMWMSLGVELDLPYKTLQVIEGHPVSQYSIGMYVHACTCNELLGTYIIMSYCM